MNKHLMIAHSTQPASQTCIYDPALPQEQARVLSSDTPPWTVGSVSSAIPLALSCPVCDSSLAYFGQADYYLPGKPYVTTTMFRCPVCHALYRDVSSDDIRGHCGVASYTDLAGEPGLYRRRNAFFRHLTALATAALGRSPKSCLDIGCSYGHLLTMLANQGCHAVGTEICAPLRTLCLQRGLQVYESVAQVDHTQRFELITLIDSLYYVSRPKELLSTLRDRLDDHGVLLIRVANRNWIAWLLRNILRREHFGRWLGDAAVAYSESTLRLLLQTTGYRIVSVRHWEAGKNDMPLPTRLFYWVSNLITYLSFGKLVISPGITVLAAKQSKIVFRPIL